MATTAPSASSTARGAPVTAGTRRPSASGRCGLSHAYRRAGFSTISVNGPGSSVLTASTAAAGSSGTRSTRTSTDAKSTAVGWIASRPFAA